jgi:phospholipid-translocating ATPase
LIAIVAATFKLCFILLSRGIKSALLSQFLSLGFIVVFVIVNFRANFSNWDYMSLTYEIFTRFDSVMSLLFNLILCIFISFTINQVRGLLLPTVYEQFAYQNNEGKAWNAIRNSEILTQTVSKTMYPYHNSVAMSQRSSNWSSPGRCRSRLTCKKVSNQLIILVLNPGDTQVTEMKLKTLSCEMKELIMEKKFKSAKLENSINHYRFFFIILFLYFGVYALADYLANLQRQFTGYQYLILFVVMAIFIAFTFMPIFKRNYYLISHLIVAIIVSLKIAIDWLSEEFGIALSAQLLAIMGSINTTNMQVMPIIIYNVAYFLQFTARVITIGVNRSDTTVEGIYSIDRVTTYTVSTIVILSFCIVVLLLYLYYQGIKQRRNDFLARDQIEQDNNLAHDILSILVPKFVQQSISSGIYNLQEAQDDVAILFLYICDFDNIMKEEGKNVVPMLDSLFRVYDNLCLQHGV